MSASALGRAESPPTWTSTAYGVTSVIYPQPAGGFQGFVSTAISSSQHFWYQSYGSVNASPVGEIRIPLALWMELPWYRREDLRRGSHSFYEGDREIVIGVPIDRASYLHEEMLAWIYEEWGGSVRISPEASRLLEYGDLQNLKCMSVWCAENHLETHALLLDFGAHRLAAAVAEAVRKYVIEKKIAVDEWSSGHYAAEEALPPVGEFQVMEDIALRAAGSRRPDCAVWRPGPEPGTTPRPVAPLDYNSIYSARY